jgi:homoserine acetyltransferase
MRLKFTYEDMVLAQHRLVSEHLGVRLKLVWQSMGCMHT